MDDFWEPAKKQLLADAKGFMDSLVKFDKDNIPDRIIKKVPQLLSLLFCNVLAVSRPFQGVLSLAERSGRMLPVISSAERSGRILPDLL